MSKRIVDGKRIERRIDEYARSPDARGAVRGPVEMAAE